MDSDNHCWMVPANAHGSVVKKLNSNWQETSFFFRNPLAYNGMSQSDAELKGINQGTKWIMKRERISYTLRNHQRIDGHNAS